MMVWQTVRNQAKNYSNQMAGKGKYLLPDPHPQRRILVKEYIIMAQLRPSEKRAVLLLQRTRQLWKKSKVLMKYLHPIRYRKKGDDLEYRVQLNAEL